MIELFNWGEDHLGEYTKRIFFFSVKIKKSQKLKMLTCMVIPKVTLFTRTGQQKSGDFKSSWIELMVNILVPISVRISCAVLLFGCCHIKCGEESLSRLTPYYIYVAMDSFTSLISNVIALQYFFYHSEGLLVLPEVFF